MSRDVDVDALFDRDADTQLLDRRRREELGLVALVAPSSSTPPRFGPESILADEAPPRLRAAMLRVALDARPERELIPGAVVTVVASVHDDGDARADDVLLRIAIPAECDVLPNSFARDDIAIDGETLLGEGLQLGTVAAGEVVRVRFAMRVLPGTRSLDVIVHVSAPGVPAIVAPALRLTRRAGHAAYHAPRPFFEMEADETDDAITAAAAIAPEPPRTVDTVVDEPAAPPIIAPDVVAVPEAVIPPVPVVKPYAPAVVIVKRAAPEPIVTEPIVIEPVVTEPVVTEPVVTEPVVTEATAPEPEPEPEPKPAPPPPPPPPPKARARKRAAPRAKKSPDAAPPSILARTLDDDDVRALERIFGGDVPHGLAALALLSSIAAVDSPLGEALGIREFARAVSAAVPRALVAARMTREVPAVVTRESLATIRAAAAAPNEPFPQYFPLLVTRLDGRELGALRTVLERDLDDVFLRGVQVLLAVAPRSLEGVATEPATRAGDALAAYRVAAGAWLMRVTVRRAVARGYDPLTAADPSLHDAGRRLVAALRAALA